MKNIEKKCILDTVKKLAKNTTKKPAKKGDRLKISMPFEEALKAAFTNPKLSTSKK